jgi:hypothetical protein
LIFIRHPLADLLPGGEGRTMPAKRARHSKAKLLRNGAPVVPAAKGTDLLTPEIGLENEGFVIDLFLDHQRQVRLTQIMHVKSTDGDVWEGWDENRLKNFFISRANLAVPEAGSETEPALSLQALPVDSAAEPVEELTSPDMSSGVEMSGPANAPLEQKETSIDQGKDHGIEIIPLDAQSAARRIAHGEPFRVRLLLADRHFARTGEKPLDFRVAISAIKKGPNSKFFIAADRGAIKSTDEMIQITVPRQCLERGVYSIAASLDISTPGTPEIASWNLRSRLLQVL